MRTKSKTAKLFNILYIIDVIAIIYFATNFPTRPFDIIKIIIMAVLIIALFVFACLSYVSRRKYNLKAYQNYVPLRNIQIEKGKEVVIVKNGVAEYPKEMEDIEIDENANLSFAKEPHTNVLSSAKIDVALVHIDQVDKKSVVVRVFKSPVALIDVAHHINK